MNKKTAMFKVHFPLGDNIKFYFALLTSETESEYYEPPNSKLNCILFNFQYENGASMTLD